MVDKDVTQSDSPWRRPGVTASLLTVVLVAGLVAYLFLPALDGQNRIAYLVIYVAISVVAVQAALVRQWWRLSVLGMALLAGVCLTVCFAPWGFWPVAYVALVPFVLACEWGRGRKATIWLIGLGGIVYWGAILYWLTWITAVGHAGATVYQATYWLLAAWAMGRFLRSGWPCWIALPLVWVSVELLRSYVIPFPWFILAHSQYMHTSLIQISDMTGQLGVSCFVAMVNGLLADGALMAIRRRAVRPRQWIVWGSGGVAVGVCLIGMLMYGHYRLGQDTQSPGPVIAVVQGANPSTMPYRTYTSHPGRERDVYIKEGLALREAGCDLVVWPESVLPIGIADFSRMDVDTMSSKAVAEFGTLFADPKASPLNEDAIREILSTQVELSVENKQALERVSRIVGCPILAGGHGVKINADQTWRTSNDAVWLDGAGPHQPSYSKLGLVPFSEYIPFRRTCKPLFNVFKSFVPPGMRFTEPGTEVVRFELIRGDDRWTLATPICFEGTISQLARRMVVQDGQKVTDVLVNMSNDGWFVYRKGDGPFRLSAEHSAHLVPYVFRAVENRVPVVRCVNTGISAWIDSDGRVVQVLGGQGGGVAAGTLAAPGVAVFGKEWQSPPESGDNIRGMQNAGDNGSCSKGVMVDKRTSIYSVVGDCFACVLGVVALVGITFSSLLKERVKT